MPQRNDLSRSLVPFQQDGTLVAVVEMSRSSWLVAGIVPGIGRHPLKKLEPSEEALLGLRVWPDYDAIVATCCEAWNALMAMPDRLASITRREWAKAVTN